MSISRRPPPDSRHVLKSLCVTGKSDLSLALGEAAVSRDNLAGALDAATQADKEQRIFVRADRTVAYEAGTRAASAAYKCTDPQRGRAGEDGGGAETRFIWIFGSVDCILAESGLRASGQVQAGNKQRGRERDRVAVRHD
jgi:hypothetical protein